MSKYTRKKVIEYSLIGKIFEQLFRIKVPLNSTMSAEWIRINGGMYVTGSRYWDDKVNTQWQELYVTISKMVDYARQGVPIAVVNPSDTKNIYDNIQQYLENAAYQFSKMYDPGAYSETLQDLTDLDRLAQVVYNHAKFYEQYEPTGNSFINMLRGYGGQQLGMSEVYEAPAIPVQERKRAPLEEIFISMVDPDRLVKTEKRDPFENMEDL